MRRFFPITSLSEIASGDPCEIAEVIPDRARSLLGKRIALVCTHGVDEVEATYVLNFLDRCEADVDVIVPDWIHDRVMTVRFLRPSSWLPFDRLISEACVCDFSAVIILGSLGWDVYGLRTDSGVLDFMRGANEIGLPIASISQGPRVLLSAGLVHRRRITGAREIFDDLRNARADVVEDQALVVDGNIITSRGQRDLSEFCRGIELYLRWNQKSDEESQDLADSGMRFDPKLLGNQIEREVN